MANQPTRAKIGRSISAGLALLLLLGLGIYNTNNGNQGTGGTTTTRPMPTTTTTVPPTTTSTTTTTTTSTTTTTVTAPARTATSTSPARRRASSRREGSTVIGMPVPQGSPGDRLLEDLGYRVRWTSWVLRLPRGAEVPDRPLPDGYAVRAAAETFRTNPGLDVKQTIVELGISDAEMDKGSLRVDANVSVREARMCIERILATCNLPEGVAHGVDAEEPDGFACLGPLAALFFHHPCGFLLCHDPTLRCPFSMPEGGGSLQAAFHARFLPLSP